MSSELFGPNYGVSIVGKEQVELLLEPDFRTLLTLAEVPGLEIADRDFRTVVAKADLVELSVAEIMPVDLCELVPESTAAIKRDFISQIDVQLGFAAELGARRAVLPMALERAFVDAGYARELVKLVQAACGHFWYRHIDLVLPVRLPAMPGVELDLQKYHRFLQKLLYPATLLADLHVHEGAYQGNKVEGWLRPVAFELSAFRLSYEPSTGNRLTERAFAPLKHYAPRNRRAGRVYFSPLGASLEFLQKELDWWRKLITGENKNA